MNELTTVNGVDHEEVEGEPVDPRERFTRAPQPPNPSIPYTVYDRATGEFKRTGSCNRDIFRSQAHQGEAVLEGTWDTATMYYDIRGDKIVERPALLGAESYQLDLGQ